MVYLIEKEINTLVSGNLVAKEEVGPGSTQAYSSVRANYVISM